MWRLFLTLTLQNMLFYVRRFMVKMEIHSINFYLFLSVFSCVQKYLRFLIIIENIPSNRITTLLVYISSTQY